MKKSRIALLIILIGGVIGCLFFLGSGSSVVDSSIEFTFKEYPGGAVIPVVIIKRDGSEIARSRDGMVTINFNDLVDVKIEFNNTNYKTLVYDIGNLHRIHNITVYMEAITVMGDNENPNKIIVKASNVHNPNEDLTIWEYHTFFFWGACYNALQQECGSFDLGDQGSTAKLRFGTWVPAYITINGIIEDTQIDVVLDDHVGLFPWTF